jgi:membrane-associated phospholipid phosphatase
MKGKPLMSRTSMVLALLCASLSVLAGSSYGAASNDEHQDVVDPSARPLNPVVQWNRTLLVIVRTPKAQPATIHPTRSFAIMHAAIYDAVNAIDRTHKPYLVRLTGVSRRSSQDAAADTAAHTVLASLYPNFQATLDTQLQQLLAQIPDGADKAEGIRIGQTVADRILALRTTDGSAVAPIPFIFGTAPGDYQSTPPNFPKQPQFTHWPQVTPFALERANEFRPGPPPALSSDTYSDVLNEVKSLGIAGSTTATPDQALTGRFWNGAIQNYWNEIAQTAAVSHSLTTAQNARLFALLDLTFADDVIAFYDAKYTYNFWRPVTAIREAATDDNPKTLPDPNWLPEVGNTTPDPAYPGAHAVISASGASVMISFFRRNHFDFSVTSEVLPGVDRSFTSFSAAAEEATLSRIFAGVHFRSDLTTGQRLGREVADFVVDNFFTPIDGSEDSDGDR